MRTQPSKTNHYITTTFTEEDALLQQVRAAGEQLVPGMQVSAMEGKLLHIFARMVQAKHVVEIGTFVGYSTIWLARALAEGGHLTTYERNPKHAAIAQSHFDQATLPITLEQRDVLEHLANRNDPIDLLFIDAEKRAYMDYLDAALPHLRPGALVVADNSLLFGALTGEDEAGKASAEAIRVMAALNERLADSDDFTGIMIPTLEGMTVGLRK